MDMVEWVEKTFYSKGDVESKKVKSLVARCPDESIRNTDLWKRTNTLNVWPEFMPELNLLYNDLREVISKFHINILKHDDNHFLPKIPGFNNMLFNQSNSNFSW